MNELKEAISNRNNERIRDLLLNNRTLIDEIKIKGVTLNSTIMMTKIRENKNIRMFKHYYYDNDDDDDEKIYTILIHNYFFSFDEIKDYINDIIYFVSPTIKYNYEDSLWSESYSKDLLIEIGNIEYIRESSYEYDLHDLLRALDTNKLEIVKYFMIEKNIYTDKALSIAMTFTPVMTPVIRFLIEELKFNPNEDIGYLHRMLMNGSTELLKYLIDHGLELTTNRILSSAGVIKLSLLKYLIKKDIIKKREYNKVLRHVMRKTNCWRQNSKMTIDSIKYLLKCGANFSIINTNLLRKNISNKIIKFVLDYNIENNYNIVYDIDMIFRNKIRRYDLSDIKYFVEKHSIVLTEEHLRMVREDLKIYKYMIEEQKVEIPEDIIEQYDIKDISIIEYLIDKNLTIKEEWVDNKLELANKYKKSKSWYARKIYLPDLMKIIKLLKSKNKITSNNVKNALLKKNKIIQTIIDINFAITEEEKRKILKIRDKKILKIIYKNKANLFTSRELNKIKKKMK